MFLVKRPILTPVMPFEWAAGFGERFGLVHVDLATLVRTRKNSYYWYRDLIAAQSPARSV